MLTEPQQLSKVQLCDQCLNFVLIITEWICRQFDSCLYETYDFA